MRSHPLLMPPRLTASHLVPASLLPAQAIVVGSPLPIVIRINNRPPDLHPEIHLCSLGLLRAHQQKRTASKPAVIPFAIIAFRVAFITTSKLHPY
ncbi:hypothetical protein BDD14_2829 [Edaphobacter modestus]|uniref:Uncharacterized protein n=1 Tax=Edaphobacter modestus TaxID=388466 RepID=A0A4V2G4K8_9BACT|nr:hypothetical protein BDD14_2829 [Edaphobacter modestus]